MRRLLLLLTLLSWPSLASGVTYYVDATSGADTNNGTSTSTAWRHAPGMNGCTSNCNSTTINGGDRIILRGGVTWGNSNWGWTLRAGTSGNPVYYGVDQTWFSGASWTRPILSGEGLVIPTSSAMIQLSNFVTVDNFEFTGLHTVLSPAPAYCTTYVYICGKDQSSFEIMNNYFHGWDYNYGPVMFVGDSHFPNTNTNSSFHNNVIDGGDSTPNPGISGNCVYGGPPLIYNNVCRNVSNGFIVNAPTSVHDNLIENIARDSFAGAHTNGFESNCEQTLYFYNNVIRHTDLVLPGSNSPAGVHVWFAPISGFTTYIYNNVLWDPPNGNNLDFGSANQGCPGAVDGGNIVMYNNTMQNAQSATINKGPNVGAATFENLHTICPSLPCIVASESGLTQITNTQQTLSAANGQGYTVSNNYAPTASSNSTVGAGTNLSGSCSGNLSALCSDTTLGCSYNSSNHTVSCPGRTTSLRPSSGTWEAGAYQFNASCNPSVASLSLSPTSVVGGNNSTGTGTISCPALAGGAIVTLSSNNTAVATVPATVTVPSGQTMATFTVSTAAVGSTQTPQISAILNGTIQATLTVTTATPDISALTLNPTSLVGGQQDSIGTATLTASAPSGGTVVTLGSNNGAVTVPATVTVPNGSISATFTCTTSSVGSPTSVTIQATVTASKTAILSVVPAIGAMMFGNTTIFGTTIVP